MKREFLFLLFILLINLIKTTYVFKNNFELTPINHEPESISNASLKRSSYWELIGTSIYIDDLNPNYNWSKVVPENDWCSGSGIWNDPYVIENVSIDAFFLNSCIEIRNSLAYFLIQNCSIFNSGSDDWDAGIKLENCNNVEIKNCKILNHNNHGIVVLNSKNITISGNNIGNSINGIRLFSSNNSLIFKNVLNLIDQQGISLFKGFNNTIRNNEIVELTDNGGYFMFLVESSYNLIIANYFDGVYLWKLNLGCGIVMWKSHINIITENIFVHFQYINIDITDGSSNNSIYKNYFTIATEACIDRGVGNKWDNGSIGNYWYTYSGNDRNGDGIGDTSFNFGTGIDRYPIWREVPYVNIYELINNKSYEKPPRFNLVITSGKDIDFIYYTLNFTEKKYFISNFSGTIDFDAWYAMNDGPLYIIFSINDIFGLQGNSAVMIIKKTKISSIFDPTTFFISSFVAIIIIIPLGIITRKKFQFKDLKSIEKSIQFKIKRTVLEFGKTVIRLTIKEVAKKTGEKRKIITPIVIDMIENKLIDADYFKSSKALVFNRKTIGAEIDALNEKYKQWDEEKISKKL